MNNTTVLSTPDHCIHSQNTTPKYTFADALDDYKPNYIPDHKTPEAVEMLQICTGNVKKLVKKLKGERQKTYDSLTVDSDIVTYNRTLGKKDGLDIALHGLHYLLGYMEAALREMQS